MSRILREQSRLLLTLATVMLSAARCTTTAATPNVAEAASACPEMQAVPMYTKGGQVVAPKPVRRVEPRVPDSLRASGRVLAATLHAIVEPDGRVSSVCVVGADDPAWGAAVAQALSSWTFEPGTVNGSPAPVRFQLITTLRAEP